MGPKSGLPMEKNTLDLLEYHNVLNFISDFCVSESGKKKGLKYQAWYR